MQKKNKILSCLFLICLCVFIYFQSKNHDFIELDDSTYVVENKAIQKGFNYNSVKFAFTQFYAANWHPITWLSHILDYQLFALNAGYHHLVNLFIHTLNCLLLFLFLSNLTRKEIESLIIAAIFAAHPIHIESVAWIAERKDILSTFFLFLSLLAYLKHDQKQYHKFYLLSLLFFIMGLMSKAMLVSTPFLLLLIDFYKNKINKKAFLEKIPFFLFSLLSCIITFYAQNKSGAVESFSSLPIDLRIINAVYSYFAYSVKLLFPHNLSVMYPHEEIGAVAFIFSCTYLIFLFWISFYFSKKMPWLPLGFLWFFISLIPVIGIIQVGAQKMADRYTYIPSVGFFIAFVFSLSKVFEKYNLKKIFISLSFIAIITLAVFSFFHIKVWKNSYLLFNDTLSKTKNNFLIHNNLGFYLSKKGELKKGLEEYYKALKIAPDKTEIYYNIGCSLLKLGKYNEAVYYFNHAIKYDNNHSLSYYALGFSYEKMRQFENAIVAYQESLKLNKENEAAQKSLGKIYFEMQNFNLAKTHLLEALKINPKNDQVHNLLAIVFTELQEQEAAIKHFKIACRINPSNNMYQNNLKTALGK